MYVYYTLTEQQTFPVFIIIIIIINNNYHVPFVTASLFLIFLQHELKNSAHTALLSKVEFNYFAV
jgi:hypothetical protein